MVPMRWSAATLARLKAIVGDKGRSAFIREAVEEKLTAVEAELHRHKG